MDERKMMVLLFLLGFGLGWLANYIHFQTIRRVDGLYFLGNMTQTEATDYANTRDSGKWVCVNVDGM